MDNKINKIRKQIKALRMRMLEAEAIMHDQIGRDEECSRVAGEMIMMRTVMADLVAARAALGDRETILVNSFFVPRRAPEERRSHKPLKRRLTPQQANAAH